MSSRPTLKSLREDWERALVVVAHPDDMEFGSAAAVAHWTDQGKQVTYCLVTSGEAGIDGMAPNQARAVREAEQRESCRIVGVADVDFLGLPDGVLEYGVALRREIAAVVRRHRPEIVITNNFCETWDGAVALNQADHIATGRATLDAARDAANRWIFTDQRDAGLEPWDGVLEVWAAGSPLSRHGVDTTDSFERGVESLRAHQAYVDGLGWENFDPAEFLEAGARAAGAALGTSTGARFQVYPLQWGATEED
ncbi:MAG: PIG-L family deacetylase [Propionibacteriales bacterium]|nr:PIG-L family deacetylase [Propionibacteriales bacterium]